MFNVTGERVEGLTPELVKIFADGVEARGIELVEAAIADGFVGDEVSVFEDFEMLGDSGARDGEGFGERANGQGALGEAGEDGAAGGVAQSVELEMLVSTH